jgi:Zn-dependent protease with chaperone function
MKVTGYRVEFDPDLRLYAEARGLWPFKRIVVGRLWYALPDHERQAVLMHEVGHCRRAHMEIRAFLLVPLAAPKVIWQALCGLEELRPPEFIRRIACNQEIEADAYAARAGFGYAMMAHLDRVRELKPTIFYPSHAERHRALAIATTRWCADQFKEATPMKSVIRQLAPPIIAGLLLGILIVAACVSAHAVPFFL